MTKSRFSITSWLIGSLIAVVLADLAMVCFVSGTDLLFGQPPQLMAPLFALIVSSCALVAVQRWKVRTDGALRDDVSGVESRRRRRMNAGPQAPAYLSMTIIRRPSVPAASMESDRVM